jgi:hypothetical protein
MRIAEEIMIEKGDSPDMYFPESHALALIGEAIGIAAQFDKERLIDFLNTAREQLHQISPFKEEPVDYVKWIPSENVTSNDYNP